MRFILSEKQAEAIEKETASASVYILYVIQGALMFLGFAVFMIVYITSPVWVGYGTYSLLAYSGVSFSVAQPVAIVTGLFMCIVVQVIAGIDC
jgi:hypothetical protein